MEHHVVFDLDGTLTDSAPGITRCLAHAVHAVGGRAPAPHVLRSLIGTPLREIFLSLLADASPSRIEQAVDSYAERFDRIGIRENSVFAGVVEALEDLRRAGCELYIATAKRQDVAERVVEQFGLRCWFRSVFGSQPDRGIWTKTDILRYAMTAASIPASKAAMVGDRHHDIHAAHTLGIRAIGVSWGYGSPSELSSARDVAHTPSMLVGMIVRAD